MGQRLKTITVFFILFSIAGLLSWHSARHMNQIYKTIKVGVTAGPQAEIMNVVKMVAARDHLIIEIIEFNDYIKLNAALSKGEIHINSFQHQPYLDLIIDDRKYDLTAIGKTVISPMGIYAKKFKNLADIPLGCKVAIPNDLINRSRALLLLEKAGLITLKEQINYVVTINDIAENPKDIAFIEVDATKINTIVNTVDMALINANYASAIGMLPPKDALILEDTTSPYVNLLVVRSQDKDNPDLQQLVTAYQSAEVKAFITEHYQGTILTAW